MDKSYQLLEDREQRSFYQNKLQDEYQKTLVVVKANYPSNDKVNNYTNYLVTKLFYHARQTLEVIEYFAKISREGLIFYLIVNESLVNAKTKMITLENSILGRLVDIDVYYNKQSISREELGFKARSCFICDDLARLCIRSKKHSLSAVIEYFETSVINDIFSEDKYANLALFGMINELLKPIGFGTVGLDSQGSHNDMDYKTFIESIDVITNEFLDFNQINHHSFSELRAFGLIVEDRMFKSTKKINTHKGIIFSLIMCLAAYANSSNYEEIHYKVKELAQDIYHDFKDKTIKNTHGQKIYDQYQIKGIRKEAYEGYKVVFQEIEPFYQETKDITQTFLKLIAYLDDTTIIKRTNLDMLVQIKKEAALIVADSSKYASFNEYLINHNISCGGSADLLSIVLIMNLIKENDQAFL